MIQKWDFTPLEDTRDRKRTESDERQYGRLPEMIYRSAGRKAMSG